MRLRTIKIQKEQISKNIYYTRINTYSMEYAACNLSHAGLRLYLYIMANKNDFILKASRAAACKHYGLSEKQFQRAFKELIEKQYLIPQEEFEDADYIGVEMPQTIVSTKSEQ